MEDVSADNNINSDTALKYLQRTTATLQTDYNNKDQQLACSVVEASHILETLVDVFDTSDISDSTMVDVQAEMTRVAELILRGICQTYCDNSNCDTTCPMTIFQIRFLYDYIKTKGRIDRQEDKI
ncbi:uncharacterized protein [Mytilus edulis]|uniref:uncharacterized protein n=1 Tax=Mytilus edulis TaxID=6550 RepID=UPI0039F0E118